MSATLPTTVISPSVSKPRKSTRMTFTTLRPPPARAHCAKKKAASTACPGRVSIAKASAAMPAAPAAIARSRERAGAPVAQLLRRGSRAASRRGSQRSPSRISTIVTVSTDDLREREIGRGEPREGQAGDEPRAADQDQCGQPMKLRLRTRRPPHTPPDEP